MVERHTALTELEFDEVEYDLLSAVNPNRPGTLDIRWKDVWIVR